MAITKEGLTLACPECKCDNIRSIHHGWQEQEIEWSETFGEFNEDPSGGSMFVGGDDYYWQCQRCIYQGDKEEFITGTRNDRLDPESKDGS